jgi:putative transcriptional regulator
MRFVETAVFTRAVLSLLSDDEYRSLQMALLLREKTRQGEFKMNKADFAKLVASVKQAGKIRRGEMKASRVFNLKPVDVRAIRNKLGLSQSDFAAMIGVSVATLQNWEQGRRRPEGPAQALLKVAAANPKAVVDALAR